MRLQRLFSKHFPKNVANLNFSAHLNNADPYANPIQAALFFKKFWSDKYELFKINFLFRNDIFQYKNQLKLANFRLLKVRKGHQLDINDFENFDNKSHFFCEAQYLLETYYEDLEMFEKHFFPESTSKNLGLNVVPTIKNDGDSEILRDFAADTLLKNGTDINFHADTLSDAISNDPENNRELRDFAAETLLKNGTAEDLTKDTLRDSHFSNIFLPKNMAISAQQPSETICSFDANSTMDTLSDPILKNTNFTADSLSAPNLKNIFPPENMAIFVPDAFINPDKQNFKKFSNFFNNKFSNFNYFWSNFFLKFIQIFTRKLNFRLNINLGGRGHRFMMTLESRIPRIKVISNHF